ncbi:hypothetical protein [Deinococcus aestuarii]|uniref:hypothetical protein n=1 Tax=Deinococcus aestuarii TaxID=2774531 RepID=UPI001C0E0663|nr:hypothetical protein [Deinococcus aestuarii]
MTDAAPLDALDHRIRGALGSEPRLSHALAYGSRTQVDARGLPLGDRWSDLEYWAFLRAGQTLDPFAFLGALVPVALAVVNPFGTPNVVTWDLTRVELHVVPVERLEEVAGWPNTGDDPGRMVLKDADGRLREALARRAASLPFGATLPEPQVEYDGVLQGLVFGSAVLARGEELRAWDQMFWVRAGLLRLARAASDAPQPPNPARRAEGDLPDRWHRALRATVSGVAAPQAYLRALELSGELAGALRLDPRQGVRAALGARLTSPGVHPHRGQAGGWATP